jgi:hypothetical protein
MTDYKKDQDKKNQQQTDKRDMKPGQQQPGQKPGQQQTGNKPQQQGGNKPFNKN